MSTVLACDPDELEVTALRLRQAADEVARLAGDVRSCDEPAWSGLAALEQAARRQEGAQALGRLVAPLEQVAGVLAEVGSAAREHGGTVRAHARRVADSQDERARLLGLGLPPEPLAAAALAERLRVLEEETAGHQRLVEVAEREFDAVRRRAAAALDDVRAQVPRVVWDVGLGLVTATQLARLRGQGAAAVGLAGAGVRLARSDGERTVHQVARRVEDHVRRLRGKEPAWLSKVPGGARVAGRFMPLVGGLDAFFAGVVRGGGYDGSRGRTTQVVAAFAVGGAVVAVGAGLTVPAGVVGLAAVAVYQGWMTGNLVYDDREGIARVASRAWSGTRSVAGRAGAGVADLAGRARRRARSGLSALRARLRGEGSTRQARSPAPTPPVAPAWPGAVPVGASA